MRNREMGQLIPSCFYKHIELPAKRPGRGMSCCHVRTIPRLCNPSRPLSQILFHCGDSDSLQRAHAVEFSETAMSICLRSSAWKGVVPALLPLDIFIDADVSSCARIGTLLLPDPTDAIVRRRALIS